MVCADTSPVAASKAFRKLCTWGLARNTRHWPSLACVSHRCSTKVCVCVVACTWYHRVVRKCLYSDSSDFRK